MDTQIENSPDIAVVTGASQGIGAAVARRLAQEGYRVALVARNRSRLDALRESIVAGGGQADVFDCDLGDPAKAERLCDQILDTLGHVDVLINSAGTGRFGPFLDMSIEDIRSPTEVRLVGPMILCRLFGAAMRDRGSGAIVSLIGPAAYFDLPYLVGYGAPQAGLLAFSRALRQELAGSGVRISTVAPAWVDTEYIHNNDTDPDWLPRISKAFPRNTPEQIAECVLVTARKRNRDVVVSWLLRLFVECFRLFPSLSRKTLRLFHLYQPTRMKAGSMRNTEGSLDWTNWEESIELKPRRVARPQTLDELVAIVRDQENYPSPVRPAGSRHSTTHCAVTDQGTLLIMRDMDKIVGIDRTAMTVTVEAGALYIDVAKALEREGLQFFVNVEIGNLTMGSAACTGTKDASMHGEYGQVCSYCTAMKLVLASGDLSEISESDSDLMQAARSSYGLFGAIYEVTFRVRPIAPLVVSHRTYDVDDFAAALPELTAESKSMMYYMYPHADRLTVEFRHYGAPDNAKPNRLLWRVRNFVWKTVASTVGFVSTSAIPIKSIRFGVIDGFYRVLAWVLSTWLHSAHTRATDQIIRYPEHKNFAKYTFSIWAFPEERIAPLMKAYFAFCKDYYQKHGYRCDLCNVGYRIAHDQNPLFSYSFDGTVMTLDPVSTGSEGWNEFLRAYNAFCSDNDDVPLFNQSKWLTRSQVRKAFGDRIDLFWRHRKSLDPEGRFLNQHFRELFAPDAERAERRSSARSEALDAVDMPAAE